MVTHPHTNRDSTWSNFVDAPNAFTFLLTYLLTEKLWRAAVQEGGAELRVRQRDRQHGADHAEPGQARGRGGADPGQDGGEGQTQKEDAEEDGDDGQPQRRLPQAPPADRSQHVRRTRTGSHSAVQTEAHRRTSNYIHRPIYLFIYLLVYLFNERRWRTRRQLICYRR